MQAERLNSATQLMQAQRMEEARALLELVLKEDRHDLKAWQLYAGTWPEVLDRKRVWEYCLRFNPRDPQALQALAALDADRSKEPAGPGKTVRNANRPAASFWMLWGGLGVFALLVLGGVIFIRGLQAKDPGPYRHAQPVEYYLYVPRAYTPDRDWPLFVGIHGSGSSGLECWNLWQTYAEDEGFILLCPSIPGDLGGYYQDVGERTVWSAVNQVQQEYRLRPRIFFAGFSAGAFFIQGFALHYPQAVSGLAILSTGYYIDGIQSPVPILVVIGDRDAPVSIQANQDFVALMRQKGFDIQYQVLPGVGHTVTNETERLTIDLFRKTIGK